MSLLGIVRLETLGLDADRFDEWVDNGYHASMSFLERYREMRRHPQNLMAGARSAIIMALSYGRRGDNDISKSPRVAQYAMLRDYHRTIWQRGENILRQLEECAQCDGLQLVGRVVTDSAPLLERALAARTSRGFIGKNTLFIHPELGSQFLLAEILLNIELPYDTAASVEPNRRRPEGGCGTCRRCEVNCPTGALNHPYRLDANLCLSYWTIEHRGTIPEKFWPWLGRYWFGCDICQTVCPYNRKSPQTQESPIPIPDIYDVAVMNQADYERWFGGTSLARAKIYGLRRNALIALTVTNHPRLSDALSQVGPGDHEVLRATVSQVGSYALLHSRE